MKTRTAVTLISLFLAGTASASPPHADICNLEKAKDEFFVGAVSYYRFSWERAIPHLDKAANVCPVPQKPFSLKLYGGLLNYPYAPFYYLGKSHGNLDDAPEALRYFYLSGCFDKAEQGFKELDELPILTADSQKRTVRLKQQDKGPVPFGNGHSAAGRHDWRKAAEQMWGSMQIRPEDDTTVVPAGRWPEQYVPRFHLATALFQLGCHRQACEQLKQTQLRIFALKHPEKYRDELKQMGWLENQCSTNQNGAHENDWICKQWVCLLQDRGSVQ